MQLLPTSALLALLCGVSLADDPCPQAGACHLPRWAPAGVPENARFGTAADLDGDTAVVGAPHEDAVYVYGQSGGQWTLVQRLEIPGASGTHFGEALCLDGDELLVGAPLADAASYFRAGLVHVFERSGGVWSPVDTLQFSFPTQHARFGASLAKEGDRIVVGSPRAWFTEEGAVAVFDRDGAGWTETVALTAPSTRALGTSVALDGAHVIGGDNANDGQGDFSGRVFAWRDGSPGWSDAEVLPAPGIVGASFLGYSVAAEGGWVAVGAYGAGSSGRVLLYRRSGGKHVYVGTIAPCDDGSAYWFGYALDLDGERLAVNALERFAPGLQGGRVQVFELESQPSPSWKLEVVLEPEDGVAQDGFGRSVAIDGGLVLGGASDVSATATNSGAAYLFSLQSELVPGGACPCDVIATSETLGVGKAGSAGVPELGVSAPAAIGSRTGLQLTGALPGAQPFLVWGFEAARIPFDGGELYVADRHVVPMQMVSGDGVSEVNGKVPNDPSLCGVELVAQAMFADPGAGGAYQLAQTNGVRVTIGW
ncbi:MAG: hypothetical protein GY711_03020 [bacterium]|nr:hypothetical protein [bacterium]